MAKAAHEKVRYELGAHVRIINPGINGEVLSVDSEPTSLGEYLHTIKTKHGEQREPGCNIELVPRPKNN